MLAEAVNEAYRMHASYNLVHGGEAAYFDSAEFEFVDPVDQEERTKAQLAGADIDQEGIDDFYADMGFT
jgi:hypothetical protein